MTTGSPARNATAAFATVTCLFFAWGFVTSNNDPLIAALRGVYRLSYTEALLTQFAFFLAYGLISLPAAALLARLGNVRAILAALATMIGGCAIVLAGTALDTYALVLVALFTLAAGITILQVAANPLAAVLGSPERSHFRLTLAQAFNSLGVVLGVQVGATVMLGDDILGRHDAVLSPAARAALLESVDHAFIIIAIMLAALATLVWVQRRRIEAAAASADDTQAVAASPLAAFRSRWAVAGAVAIFFYVGAEVTIGSLLINFLHERSVLALPLETAGRYLAWIYWFGALVGRFVGSALLTRLPAAALLSGAAGTAMLLCLVTFSVGGPIGAWAALGVGFFNSIMFPTIFTLTLERSSASIPATSGALCFAIVGGAVLPLLAGLVTDSTGEIARSFVVPAAAYAVVLAFAFAASRAATVRREAAAPILH